MELNETIVRRKAANGKSTDKLSQSEEDALLLQSFLEVDTEINSNYNSNAHNSYNKNDFGAFDPSNMPSLLENAAAATASLTSTSTATVASQTQLQGQSSAASSTENQASIDPLSPMYSSSTPPPSTALAGTSHSARSIATDFPSSIPPPLPNNREVGKTGAASLLQSQASASTSASTSSATASTVASEQGQGQEGVDFSGPSGGAIKMVDGVLPGRYRLSDILGARPGTARWDTSRPRGPTLQQQQAQYMYKQMYQAVYRNFESVCKERMPQPFIVFCAQTMHDFPRIAQGLHYNDRPDTICMDLKYCDEQSYVFNAPHARFVSERGPP